MSTDYIIADDHREQFRKDGHILLRGLASPAEAAEFRTVVGNAAERFKSETRRLEDRDTYGKAFLQTTNLWAHDEGVRQIAFTQRFARVAAALMGVPAVRLYADQALYKEPHGGHTPWHQDQNFWPLDTDNTITMWMPLVDVPVERGALTFASGSHLAGSLGDQGLSDDSDAFYEPYIAEKGFPIAVSPMAAGDATFHAGWTLHYAPPNTTGEMREVMTVIYYADGARLLEPTNIHHTNALGIFFPGLAPGDLAASAMNPLLYGPADSE